MRYDLSPDDRFTKFLPLGLAFGVIDLVLAVVHCAGPSSAQCP